MIIVEAGVDFDAAGVGAFRALRLLRIFKFFKNWKSIHSLLRTIQRSFSQMQNLLFLMFLCIFIFGTTGVQLLGERLMNVDPDDRERSNYQNIWWSMITCFQLITADMWGSLMGDAYLAYGGVGSGFVLIFFFLGSYIGLSMFSAIVLFEFGEEDTLEQAIEIREATMTELNLCRENEERFDM